MGILGWALAGVGLIAVVAFVRSVLWIECYIRAYGGNFGGEGPRDSQEEHLSASIREI
jgi:hypothetical protein